MRLGLLSGFDALMHTLIHKVRGDRGTAIAQMGQSSPSSLDPLRVFRR